MSSTIHNHPKWKPERNLNILKEWRDLEARGEENVALTLAFKYKLTPSRLYQIKSRTEKIENELRKTSKDQREN